MHGLSGARSCFGLRPSHPRGTRHTIREKTHERKEQRATVIHSRRSDVGFYPWLTIESARWLKIRSAPTAMALIALEYLFARIYVATGARSASPSRPK